MCKMPNYISLLKYIVIFIFCETNAQSIKFYKYRDFSGLLYDGNSTATCSIFPSNTSLWTRSIRTDSCFIVYEHLNCDPIYSKKINNNESFEEHLSIRSFHSCNENNGGSQLNLDIMTFENDTSSNSSVSHSYTDVCTCINVPGDILETDRWLIDNHGNEVLAYFEPNCSSTSLQPTYIRAGHSWLSRNIYRHQNTNKVTKIKHNILSFGPHPNSTYYRKNCKYLKIMEFESFDISNSSSQNVLQLPHNKTDDNEVQNAQFFAKPNFEDLLFESNLSETCNNIVNPNNNGKSFTEVSSIKTNKCIMVYLTKDCRGRSLKISHGGNNNLTNAWEATVTNTDTMSLIYDTIPDWTWDVKSFKFCTETLLNFDITSYEPDLVATPSTVLKSYKNVCECQNIPKNLDLERDQWSINNYDNSMMAYFEQDCLSSNFNPLWIPAGRSSYSMGISSFQYTDETTGEVHKIQSFGPDLNSEHFLKTCVKIYAKITEFEVVVEQDLQNFITESVQMTSFQTVLENSGLSNLTQNFSASQVVNERFQIDIGTSLYNLDGLQVEDAFNITIKMQNLSSQHNDSSAIVNPTVDVDQSNSSLTLEKFFNEETSLEMEDIFDSSAETRFVSSLNRTEIQEQYSSNISVYNILDIGNSSSLIENESMETDYDTNLNKTIDSGSSQTVTTTTSSSQEILSTPPEESIISSLTSKINNSNLRKAFKTAYEVSNTTLHSQNTPTFEEYTNTLIVSRVINVPPCTEQVVNAYFKILKMNQTKYRALVKITGKLGNRDMNVVEVRRFLDKDLEYVGDYDKNTILVYSSGYFNALFGDAYFAITNENTISQCLEQKPECSMCQSSNELDTSNFVPPCHIPDEILRHIYGHKLE